MTILFMTRKYPPSVGGMERFAYALSEHLKSQATIKIIKWGGSNRYLPLIIPFFFIKANWLLLRGEIDIIYAQDGVLSPLALILSRIYNKPFTVVIHGLDITYSNRLFQGFIPACVRKASLVFCISRGTADEVVQRGIPKSIVRVVPLGVEVLDKANNADIRLWKEKLNIPEGSQLLLTAGRLVKRKGVVWFVREVMPLLVKIFPNVIYVIIGEGPERPLILENIKEYTLNNNVRLAGRVSESELSCAYSACDIFVQPNIKVLGDIEGFGLVLLEAATFALPIVASGIEGINDAINNNINGILVNSGDAKEYIKAIEKLLSNETAAKELGARAQKYTIDNYSWQAISQTYFAELRKLIP